MVVKILLPFHLNANSEESVNKHQRTIYVGTSREASGKHVNKQKGWYVLGHDLEQTTSGFHRRYLHRK